MLMTQTLYSYCLAHDKGSAPNPYGGICTLTICKPEIRKSAKKGDWIVGTSSKKTGSNLNMVYTMKVNEKMTLQEYDNYCKQYIPYKIPKPNSKKYEERQGDCILDYSESQKNPKLRENENHDDYNMKRDVEGRYSLLATEYYYFGNNAISIPESLQGIIKFGPGHKSGENHKYLKSFLDWVENISKKYTIGIHGKPFLQ